MDWYTPVRFVHIVAAILWLGGAFAMLIGALLIAGSPDKIGIERFMKMLGALRARLFMPASMTVLATGLAVCWLWFGLSAAWLVLALAGTAASSSIGALFLKPAGARILESAEAEGATPAVIAQLALLTRVVRFDFAIMLSIAALMVFKPGWQDGTVLFALGLFLALAAAVLLIPRSSRAAHAAA